MAVKTTPDGWQGVTPYLIVKGAAEALDFYQRAFGATEKYRLADPGGKVGHAEMAIGGGFFMLADEHPEMGIRGPQSVGGTPVMLLVYVPDVDRSVAQATAAGAKVLRPLQNQFYGDRSATLEDPFGHIWTLATHTEDIAPAEIKRRFDEMVKGPPPG